ncbi:unnamed protein product [Lactuca saligna]|uniref:CBS domain-containing protein n=1 Tax=Lactuca saligna TaxID=75948 RepID=A0AA35Z121_LACSI|nr:unnamed protein product [Lactuca saligna]
MVHTQFIWSHGGNQVFLCGDFTGWIKYQPMVPVEGLSSTFSTICDLPPGLHKYKFLVDGIWRINEQQLFAEDEYGVNNIVVVKQPEVMPHTLIIDDGVPIMDIDSLDDHNPADDASTSISVPPHELVMPLRAEDIEATHHRLSDHLSSYTVYDLIPDSGKVFALDANVSVEEAFLVMHEEVDPDETLNAVAVKIMHNRISSVPVLNMAQDTACPQLLHVACLGGILKLKMGDGMQKKDNGAEKMQKRYCWQIDPSSMFRVDHATISQALQLVDKKGHPRFGICTRSDTLYQVITLLSNPGVRRVVVVEAATQRVLGLITLRDVFTLIFRDFH